MNCSVSKSMCGLMNLSFRPFFWYCSYSWLVGPKMLRGHRITAFWRKKGTKDFVLALPCEMAC